MKEIDKDVNGKVSSKRFWAKRFFTLGYYLAIVMFVMWGIGYIFINKEFVVPDALIEIWIWMMGFAAAVILGTVFERPEPRIKQMNNNCSEDEEIVIPPIENENVE